VILGHFWPIITPLHLFSFFFNINKWFSHRSSFYFCLFCDFVVWVRRFVVRRLVRRYLISCILRCSFDSYWKIGFSQLQIQSMIWASTLQIRSHRYSGHFNFIILFVVGILPLYAINSDAVSMFADSSFTFLVILNMWLYDVFYQFEWMNIVLFLSKKKSIKRQICVQILLI
jgi:hypothetical protein